MNYDLPDARRAIERVRADLGESRVRAGRDHDVLEAARWAAELYAELANLRSEASARVREQTRTAGYEDGFASAVRLAQEAAADPFATVESVIEALVYLQESSAVRSGDVNSEEFRVARNAIIDASEPTL